MLDKIITIILFINSTFLFVGIALWLIKKSNHLHSVLSSLALLRYSRILLILGLVSSAILALAVNPLALSYLPLPLALGNLLLLICGIGFFRYAHQIIQLVILIRKAVYRRRINGVCLIYCDQTKACSFILLNKAYIVIPVSIVENYQVYILTIRHEMQHCRQRDGLWQQLMAMIGIVCWWCPFYQVFNMQSRHMQEICCDQAVLNKYGLSAKEYISTLLTVRDKHHTADHFKLINSHKKNTLCDRAHQMFHQPINRFEQFWVWLRIVLISFFVLFSSVWSINATAEALTKYNALQHFQTTSHVKSD